MIERLLWLAFAHAVGDMGLQHTGISAAKPGNQMVMLAHSIIVSGCICVALKYMGRYSNFKFIILIETHILIDYLSVFFVYYVGANYRLVNLVDQILHAAVILIIA